MVLPPVVPSQRLSALSSFVGCIGPIRSAAKGGAVALELADDRGMTSSQPTTDLAQPNRAPDITISNFLVIRKEIMPSQAVLTSSSLTPIAFAIRLAISTSKPMISPFLLVISKGIYPGSSPTRRDPRLRILSRVSARPLFGARVMADYSNSTTTAIFFIRFLPLHPKCGQITPMRLKRFSFIQQLFNNHRGATFRTSRQFPGKVNDFRVSATGAFNLNRFHFATFHARLPRYVKLFRLNTDLVRRNRIYHRISKKNKHDSRRPARRSRLNKNAPDET